MGFRVAKGNSRIWEMIKRLTVLLWPTPTNIDPGNCTRNFFFRLLERCHKEAPFKKKFRFKNKLVSLDSTVIDLCVSVFDWAKLRRTKGAIKLHLLLDHDGYLPCFGVITEGKVHDVKVAWSLAFEAGTGWGGR